MQAHSIKQKPIVPLTPLIGKVDIHVAREGLAMVMDGLRVMETARVKVSKATILFDGKICVLPVIEIPDYLLGILVMDNGERVFTTNGVSVMDKMSVMDENPLKDNGHG